MTTFKSLEQLIEEAQKSQEYLTKHRGQRSAEIAEAYDAKKRAHQAIAEFVLDHADTFINFERQHMLCTPPFDGDEL